MENLWRYLFPLLLGMALFFAFHSMGFAHDYEKPELQDWFMSLHNRNHGLCCDGKDAAHVEADDWGTQDKPDSHYWVNFEGERLDVPDSAIVDDPNKEGQALVWAVPLWFGTKMTHYVRCFMPGTLS